MDKLCSLALKQIVQLSDNSIIGTEYLASKAFIFSVSTPNSDGKALLP